MSHLNPNMDLQLKKLNCGTFVFLCLQTCEIMDFLSNKIVIFTFISQQIKKHFKSKTRIFFIIVTIMSNSLYTDMKTSPWIEVHDRSPISSKRRWPRRPARGAVSQWAPAAPRPTTAELLVCVVLWNGNLTRIATAHAATQVNKLLGGDNKAITTPVSSHGLRWEPDGCPVPLWPQECTKICPIFSPKQYLNSAHTHTHTHTHIISILSGQIHTGAKNTKT